MFIITIRDYKFMEISQLRAFCQVVRTGSMTKAARDLYCVQSNITARIKCLESIAKTPLFYRVGKKLVLTPAGKTLYSYAEKILKLVDESKIEIEENMGYQGTLSIGSMESTAMCRLPALLAEFHHKYKDVDLSLQVAPSATLIRDVLDFKLDCAFVAGKQEHPDLIYHKVFTEKLVVITDLKQKSLKTLSCTNLLAFAEGCFYRQLAESWIKSHHATHFKTIQFGSMGSMIGGVIAGMGLAVIPMSVVEQYRDQSEFKCFPLPAKTYTVDTYLVHHKSLLKSKAMEAFIEQSLSHFNSY